ncbi:MAG: putative porin, partial [Bacteroidota bacterium]
TPKRRYKLLAHFLYYQFDNKEQGGLFSTELSRQNMDSLFIASEGSLTERLTDATIRQDGRRLRLYHEYAIAPKNFAIFHSFSLEREANRFRDEAYTSNPQYYDTLYYLTPTEITSVSYRSQFRTLENIGGIKARAGDFQLRGYAKYRNYQYSTTSLQDSIPQDTVVARDLPSELFVGGQLRLRLDSQRSIGGFAEYLIAGGYKFGGKLRFRDFEARYQRTSYAPSLAEQDRRFGNHYRWDNRDFKNTILDDVEGSYTYQHEKDSLWGFTVTPFGRFRNFQRLVFFDQNSLAAQDSTSFQMANLGFRGKLRYKYWRTNMLFMFSESFDRNTIRVPQFFLNWSIYYERELFNGVMPAQLGIDIHWKSRFKGNQYNVAIQQFHLQDQNLIANYVYADLFWNFRVNRVFLFLKVNNVLQGAFAENYFETPFYFGQPRSFEFGFQWRFFD